MTAVLFLPFFRRVKRLLFSPKKSATATTADTDANKINIQFHRTRTFHNDIFASAMWQGWQNPISCDDEPALHFRGVAASRRAWMGMVRYYDGFSRLSLCYPTGGAGETGKNEDNGRESSRLSSEISVSDAKDSKNNTISDFGLIGNTDLGG